MVLKPFGQLQLRVGLATGGSTATDLAVTATDGDTIGVNDTIVAVLRFIDAGAIESLASIALTEASVETAGSIQFTTTDTSSNQLMVFWHASSI